MDLHVIACAIAGLFFAGVIKGATGIGYSSCALPFLVAALGLKTAIVLVVVPAMASNVLLLFTTGHVRDTVKRFWPLYAATLPGILFGIVLLSWVDKHIPTQCLGALIVLYVLQAWAKPDFVLQPRIARAAQVPVGLLNGVLTGFTGSQVLPLMPYMLSLKTPAQPACASGQYRGHRRLRHFSVSAFGQQTSCRHPNSGSRFWPSFRRSAGCSLAIGRGNTFRRSRSARSSLPCSF